VCNLANVNGTLFFCGWDGTDWEVWTVDGSTASKIDVNPLGSSEPSDFTAFGGTVYFSAYRLGDGRELFRLDPDPANTAPTLGNGTLAAVAEDTLSPPGATVASVFAGEFSDPDADSSLSGIAVVGNTADAGTEGVWQYSTDGTHWAHVGSVNDSGAALSLASTTRVRFLPAEDYNGTPPALTVRGMDDTYAGGFSSFDGTTETRVTVDTTTHGGAAPLADATSTLSTSVTSVVDPPSLKGIEQAALPYTENDPATAISASILAGNESGSTLTGAVIQITGNYQKGQDVLSFVKVGKIKGKWNSKTGTLTLSGTDTVANYETALRAVKFQTGVDPGSAIRTVSFTTSDGVDQSVAATRTIVVKPVNDAPVLAAVETTPLAYANGQAPTAISDTITVADVDNAVLASATVQITGGYKKGQDFLAFEDTDKITGVFDAKKGLLTLTSIGDATVADFEAALRAVTYQNTSESPKTGKRTVSFKVSDRAAWSKAVKRTLQVTAAAAANDAALLAMFGSLGQAGSLPHGRGLQAGRVAG